MCCWFCLTSSVRWQKEPLPFDATAVCTVWSTQQSFLVSYLYWIFGIYLMLWLNRVSLKNLLKMTFELYANCFWFTMWPKRPRTTQKLFSFLFIHYVGCCLCYYLYNLWNSGLHRRQKYHLLPASFAFLLPLHQVDCDITCIFACRLVKLVLSQDGKTPFDNNLSVTAFPGMFDCSLVV